MVSLSTKRSFPNIHPLLPCVLLAQQIIFEGRVQGVGFRYSVKQLAMGFDVIGWIKNQADGSVEMQVMGELDELEEFLQEITEESTMSHNIQSTQVHDIALLDGVKGFRIVS